MDNRRAAAKHGSIDKQPSGIGDRDLILGEAVWVVDYGR